MICLELIEKAKMEIIEKFGIEVPSNVEAKSNVQRCPFTALRCKTYVTKVIVALLCDRHCRIFLATTYIDLHDSTTVHRTVDSSHAAAPATGLRKKAGRQNVINAVLNP